MFEPVLNTNGQIVVHKKQKRMKAKRQCCLLELHVCIHIWAQSSNITFSLHLFFFFFSFFFCLMCFIFMYCFLLGIFSVCFSLSWPWNRNSKRSAVLGESWNSTLQPAMPVSRPAHGEGKRLNRIRRALPSGNRPGGMLPLVQQSCLRSQIRHAEALEVNTNHLRPLVVWLGPSLFVVYWTDLSSHHCQRSMIDLGQAVSLNAVWDMPTPPVIKPCIPRSVHNQSHYLCRSPSSVPCRNHTKHETRDSAVRHEWCHRPTTETGLNQHQWLLLALKR